MRLAAFSVLRNGVALGYPFIEAYLSVLPAVDQLVVGECYSDDSTWYWLRRLERAHPGKVTLLRFPWPESHGAGLAIGRAQEAAFRACDGATDWSLLVQADELHHPATLPTLRAMPETAAASGCRSVGFRFVHLLDNFQTEQETPGYREAIRMVRQSPDIQTCHDGFTFEGRVGPTALASLAHPVYHCGYNHLLTMRRKRINHAGLYPVLPVYQETAAAATRELHDADLFDPSFDRTESPYPLPPIVRGLVGLKEYHVREALLRMPLDAVAEGAEP